MTKKCVLTKTYRWMIVSDDGLLKTPKDHWGETIFENSYRTEEKAVADYQRYIGIDVEFPYSAVLIPEYFVDYIF